MYLKHWGLKAKPFENTPDPHFFYASPKHEEALTRLLYTVFERKGAAMLSGEYGSGKTLLSRVLTSKLLDESDRYNVAIIINPNIPAEDLLDELNYQLGKNISRERSKSEAIRELNNLLYETANQGKHTVIIVDEAQAIKDDKTFEELRLLLNFQLNDRFLLTLLLFGQPELREKVNRLKQLEQRLSLKYHLTNLNAKETKRYVEYRCELAGATTDIFTAKTFPLIHQNAQGIPRVINNICDMALVVGMSQQKTSIDEKIIKSVISDLVDNNVTVENNL
ncbi:MAG: AAA family ATPase [Planctomycetes bacterium]|nr:AAA family ATPase [Planctomycetota bacterium]